MASTFGRRAFGAGVATVAGLGMAGAPVGAASTSSAPREDAKAEEHCITDALSGTAIERGAVSALTCFPTYGEAMVALGLARPGAVIEPGSAEDPIRQPKGVSGRGRPQARFPSQGLAQHWNDLSQTGSSITVNGTTCDGSGIQFGFGHAWNNRIRSTVHLRCYTIKHYPGDSYDGNWQTTEGNYGNPRTMNTSLDRETSSIMYHLPTN